MNENDRDDDALRAALAKMPRSIEPARDLWPGIAARIAPAARPGTYRRWGIAAAIAIAVGTAAAGLALRPTTPTNRYAVTPAVNAPAATSPATEADYFGARARFAAAAVRNSTGLAPNTRAVLLHNLAIIEKSMGNIRQALARDPNDLQLRRLLYQLYQDEAALLNAAQQVQLQTTTRTAL